MTQHHNHYAVVDFVYGNCRASEGNKIQII